MIECPNCGGNLKFDITTQDMGCEHCGAHFDTYAFDNKTEDAVEQDYFETTIFTCPQCGGELMGTDNASATFCSFCGASTILHSRISKSRRPKYILPFIKTKEDCKKAYMSMAKRAIFAPDDLKNEECIESFRGIYIPYWFYEITQNGSIDIEGTDSYRRGDYIITEHYALTGLIDAFYNGINFDAASSFSDNISRKVAPFDINVRYEFTPAFFSGFYADTADVSASLYQDDAMNTAFEIAREEINRVPEYEGLYIDWNDKKNGPDALKTHTDNVLLAMFPVWFMAYRNKDRVVYATVNGQTGKVVADFPVDIKKYLIASGVLTIPIFLLLNLFFTFRPIISLFIVAIISLIANVMFLCELSSLVKKENYEDDKGRMGKEIKANKTNLNSSLSVNGVPRTISNKAGQILAISVLSVLGIIVLVLVACMVGINIGCVVLAGCGVCLIIANCIKVTKLEQNKKSLGLGIMFIALMCTTLVAFVNPVSDVFYYGAVILLMISVLMVIVEIMEYYNMLTTRKLPQFDRTGGDDRA